MVEIVNNQIILDSDMDLINSYLDCQIETTEIIGFKVKNVNMIINIIDALTNIKVPKIQNGMYKIYVDRTKDNKLYIEYKGSKLYLCYDKEVVVPQVVDGLTIITRTARGLQSYSDNYDYIVKNSEGFINTQSTEIERDLMTLDTYHAIPDIIITKTDKPNVFNYFTNYISYEYLQSLFADNYTEVEKQIVKDALTQKMIKDDPIMFNSYFTSLYDELEELCSFFKSEDVDNEVPEEWDRFKETYGYYEDKSLSEFKKFIIDKDNFNMFPYLDEYIDRIHGVKLHMFLKDKVGV